MSKLCGRRGEKSPDESEEEYTKDQKRTNSTPDDSEEQEEKSRKEDYLTSFAHVDSSKEGPVKIDEEPLSLIFTQKITLARDSPENIRSHIKKNKGKTDSLSSEDSEEREKKILRVVKSSSRKQTSDMKDEKKLKKGKSLNQVNKSDDDDSDENKARRKKKTSRSQDEDDEGGKHSQNTKKMSQLQSSQSEEDEEQSDDEESGEGAKRNRMKTMGRIPKKKDQSEGESDRKTNRSKEKSMNADEWINSKLDKILRRKSQKEIIVGCNINEETPKRLDMKALKLKSHKQNTDRDSSRKTLNDIFKSQKNSEKKELKRGSSEDRKKLEDKKSSKSKANESGKRKKEDKQSNRSRSRKNREKSRERSVVTKEIRTSDNSKCDSKPRNLPHISSMEVGKHHKMITSPSKQKPIMPKQHRPSLPNNKSIDTNPLFGPVTSEKKNKFKPEYAETKKITEVHHKKDQNKENQQLLEEEVEVKYVTKELKQAPDSDFDFKKDLQKTIARKVPEALEGRVKPLKEINGIVVEQTCNKSPTIIQADVAIEEENLANTPTRVLRSRPRPQKKNEVTLKNKHDSETTDLFTAPSDLEVHIETREEIEAIKRISANPRFESISCNDRDDASTNNPTTGPKKRLLIPMNSPFGMVNANLLSELKSKQLKNRQTKADETEGETPEDPECPK